MSEITTKLGSSSFKELEPDVCDFISEQIALWHTTTLIDRGTIFEHLSPSEPLGVENRPSSKGQIEAWKINYRKITDHKIYFRK